jgi:hypothetical protein
MKVLMVKSKEYAAVLDEQNYEWINADQWLIIKSKNGKWKLEIPKEAIYYIIEEETDKGK